MEKHGAGSIAVPRCFCGRSGRVCLSSADGCPPGRALKKTSYVARSPVRELRLALTVENYDELSVSIVMCLACRRSVVGQPHRARIILTRDTRRWNCCPPIQTDLVDRVEWAKKASPAGRLALEVEDSVERCRSG